MAKVDNIRNGLIDKIMSIRNKAFLEALDKLVSSSAASEEVVYLTDEQKEMLKMAEEDLKYGRVVSQEDMMKRHKQWLDEK